VEVKVLEMQFELQQLKTITFTISAEMHLKFRTQPYPLFHLIFLQDTLPDIECVDTIIYCPINLKPIGSLSIDDFRNDFEINVIGAVKKHQNTLTVLKKGKSIHSFI
jgi:hypothetical protein